MFVLQHPALSAKRKGSGSHTTMHQLLLHQLFQRVCLYTLKQVFTFELTHTHLPITDTISSFTLTTQLVISVGTPYLNVEPQSQQAKPGRNKLTQVPTLSLRKRVLQICHVNRSN